MGKTKYSIIGNIAFIELDNPPLNTWGYDQRVGVSEALDKAISENDVKAIVITGTDRAFSGGADITEFGTPKMQLAPNLNDIIHQVETASKPVVAAISGLALGGGLEFAMGCHYRVATPDASLGQPEVKLGIIPGGGGTQRLPRLVGAEFAVNMIASGNPIPAAKVKHTQLIDEIIEGDFKEGAIAFAQKLVEQNRPLRRTRDIKMNMLNADAFFEFARGAVASVSKGYPAPVKCVDTIENAAKMSFDKGIQAEQEAFISLMMTPESRSLRHIFFSERAVSKIPGISEDIKPRSINNVAVIGAGTMGRGIAMCFLNAGLPVTLVETQQEGLDLAVEAIAKTYEMSVKKGKMTIEKADAAMTLLNPTIHMEAISDADLIIEAIFEKMDLKEDLFRQLDQLAKQGAILASNTSFLDLNQLAAVTNRPADVVGMHFFSPANVMKLLEVVRGDETASDVLVTVMKLAKKIKKTAVVAGVCHGFIGNRMIEKYVEEAFHLVMHGASPYQVDKALEKWGMVMGPFRMMDMVGNDVGWQARQQELERDSSIKKTLRDKLCERGRFGQKAGMGWYQYPPGSRDALPDKDVEQMIADTLREENAMIAKFSDQDIVDRCIYALVNEGARIVEEGIAARASDVDIVYIYGYGFPPYRGGPMNYANEVGLYNVARRMRQFAAEPDGNKDFWTPAALIEQLIEQGKSF